MATRSFLYGGDSGGFNSALLPNKRAPCSSSSKPLDSFFISESSHSLEEMRMNPNVSIPPLQNPQPIDIDAIIAAMATRQPQQPSNDDIEDDHDDEETDLQDD
ncbi:hypothetical protein L6452_35062 [Arctium lappa]|uniref:Uncharacterized protein n=1 Tax=Arctium lappa TaxID=4217 RepID=A0ACB8YKG5_ARCLA|nr:hypothetical protein L6452_35062 [Arctium lappa]